MPKRQALQLGNIQHCGAVRIQMNGSGNLDMTLHSMPDEDGNTTSDGLVPLVLTPTQRRSQTQLANFKSEAIALEVSVDTISEYFLITGLVIFTRPVETGYPQ